MFGSSLCQYPNALGLDRIVCTTQALCTLSDLGHDSQQSLLPADLLMYHPDVKLDSLACCCTCATAVQLFAAIYAVCQLLQTYIVSFSECHF